MNDRKDIFKLFCKYVDDTIFKENIGSVVSFVVDQSYIDSFCEKYSIGESELLDEVRKNMYRYNASIDHVKGIIAIQVYAATKRADDYIMKPYTIRNVIARVKSVLRRTLTHKNIIITDNPDILKVDGLQLDLGFKRCTIEGREIKLAKKEFELLAYLISNH